MSTPTLGTSSQSRMHRMIPAAALGLWAAAGMPGVAHAQTTCQIDDLFGSPASFDSDDSITQSRANGLTVGDFDNDGRLDVVTVGLVSGQPRPVVSLLRGQGDGRFGPAEPVSNFDLGLLLSSSVISTDIDGDGNLDLVVTDGGMGGVPDFNPIDGLRILVDGAVIALGDGAGGFANEFTLVTGQEPWDVRSGDFDGDGVIDLAFSNGRVRTFDDQANPTATLPATVTVRFGLPDGGFSPVATTFQSAESGSHIVGRDLVVADFNNDGNDDLAVRTSDNLTSTSANIRVSLHLSNGDRTFAPPQTISSRNDGGATIRAADLDADGDLDIFKPNTLGDNIGVLRNNGDGTFAPETTIPAPDANEAIAADLNGDGILDLAAPTLRDTVAVHLGNGGGFFQPAREFDSGDRSPAGIEAADLDSDGDLDLITTQSFHGNVAVLNNEGDARFGIPTFSHSAGPWVLRADFDADGRLDLLTGSTVRFATADGLASGGVRVETGIPLTSEHRVAVVDTNGDGLPDIVGARDLPPARTEAQLEIYLNNGDRTFNTTPITRTLLINRPESIAVADLNADGTDDLAIAVSGDTIFPFTEGSDVVTLINLGETTFSQSSTPTRGIFPSQIDAADFDGDGRIDLAVSGRSAASAPTLEILVNNASGGFDPGDLVTPLGFGRGRFVITDFNADGHPDLVAINNSGNDENPGRFSVFENDESGGLDFVFDDAADFPIPLLIEELQPVSIDAADFDGDGLEDLAIGITAEAAFEGAGIGDSPGPFRYIAVLLNEGGGQFGDFGINQPVRLRTGGANPPAVFAADLTADGASDILFSNGTFSVGLIQNRCVTEPICRADLTGSSDPNDPSFGSPDGDADGDDFFFYLDAFTTADFPVCDLTGSSDPNDPSFDVPDADCDGDDFFRYLDLFVAGCN